MKVVRAVPTESISEELSVQRLSEALGVRNLRANVFTLAECSMSKHLHREQEEVYLVLDGPAMIDVDQEQFKVGEREALAVPGARRRSTTTPRSPTSRRRWTSGGRRRHTAH